MGTVCVFKCKLNSILALTIRQVRLAKKTWLSVFDVGSGGWGWVRGWGEGLVKYMV